MRFHVGLAAVLSVTVVMVTGAISASPYGQEAIARNKAAQAAFEDKCKKAGGDPRRFKSHSKVCVLFEG